MRKLCSKRKIQIHLPRFIISTWSGSTGHQPAPAARLESWDHKYRDNRRTNTSSQARRIQPEKLDLRLRLEPLILKPNPCGNSKNIFKSWPRQSSLTYKHLVKIVLPLSRPTHKPGTESNLWYNLNTASPHLVGMRPHVGGHNSCCDSAWWRLLAWRGDNSSALESASAQPPASS